jgi:hypothetical protein
MKFVVDTTDYCFKINAIYESEEWDLVSCSDSIWAGNPETRISLTGLTTYLLDAPIFWRSKGQKREAQVVKLSTLQ